MENVRTFANITELMTETEQQFKLDPPVSKAKPSSLTLQLQTLDFSRSLLGGKKGVREEERISVRPAYQLLTLLY